MSDIEQSTFPQLNWTKEEAFKSAGKIHAYVTDHAKQSQKWYLKKKNNKKIFGFYLRIVAMICTAIAGIIPMLANVFVTDKMPVINPALSGVAIAVAALLIAFDKFGDLTKGWVRYMLTAQEIGNRIDTFQFQWEKKKLQWNGAALEQEQIDDLITTCSEFVNSINLIVLEESKAWATEFLSNMKEIEKAAKLQFEAVKLGGINITVVDGEKYDSGWTVKVNTGKKRPCNGETASISRLYEGIHTIAIEGVIGGKKKFVETSVEVPAGKIIEISLEPK